ncbi:mechanosensitive ion channel protein 1, mitochondrial [Andrographis paniculata]|uniref:mechanosensitive ion channel protein 1, mitochondrial n=1 Tax=Andrographis paniculata TaxID=175694 RepID=UPI0021E8E15D|nr:mechanosensitive ion channel protein 1, mitochondrial [Andrographis paniculata]
MRVIRISSSTLHRFTYSLKSAPTVDIRPTFTCTTSRFHHSTESPYVQSSLVTHYSTGARYESNFANKLLGNSGFPRFSLLGIDPVVHRRFFSSASESKGNAAQVSEIIAESSARGTSANVTDGGVGGDNWVLKFKQLWQSTVGALKYTEEKAKEVSNEVAPHLQQWLDGHPYLKDVIVPVGGTLMAALLAWSLLPRLFRKFHKYSVEGPGALLSRSSLWGPAPYENSFWGALEVPVRYFITLMAILEIGEMVAPNVVASQYGAQAWRGALVVSLLWFLNRWKTNLIARALAAKSIERIQRDKLRTLDRISSVGLFVIGTMALAEACGVAVQSILTVGGVGGVATAFAARDILGNVLSGLSVQIAQPFSVGDTIKAGSVEGQVVEMGLTTTSLLTSEKFPVIVPNSLFSSQIIVNKSRAKWHVLVKKIPLQVDDIDKISQITEDIKSMLRSNSNVFLEMEAPYCYLSQIERSYAELTIGCNLKQKNVEAEEDVLLEAIRIIKQHGTQLGRRHEDSMS